MEAVLLRQDDRYLFIYLLSHAYETLEKTEANYKKSPKERLTKSYIESRLATLESMWAKFEEDHYSIVSSVKKSERKAMEYFLDDHYMRYEEKYMGFKTKLKEDLFNSSQKSVHQKSVKLPQINLPIFSGKYDDWQTFNDIFVSLIHNNKSLSDVQKLHYLKSSLSGEPENLLRHFAIADANYTEAWKQLKHCYNNKHFNSNELMKTLFNQKIINSESASAIKNLLDTTLICLESLINLGINTSSWDPMIIYLVVSKLDNETRKMWEHKVGLISDEGDLPTWIQLIEFLESRCRALEMIDSEGITRDEYQSNKSQHSQQSSKSDIAKPKSFHSAVHVEITVVNNTCRNCHQSQCCPHFMHFEREINRTSNLKYDYLKPREIKKEEEEMCASPYTPYSTPPVKKRGPGRPRKVRPPASDSDEEFARGRWKMESLPTLEPRLSECDDELNRATSVAQLNTPCFMKMYNLERSKNAAAAAADSKTSHSMEISVKSEPMDTNNELT